MTARDRTGKFTAERTTTTVTERLTVEPGTPGPLLPAQEWARLTAPLDTAAPVILTPAARAEWAELADGLRTEWGADGIRAFNDASEAAGCQATYGPCIHPLLAAGATPDPLPSQVVFPAMMP